MNRLARILHPRPAARSVPLGRLAIGSTFVFVILFLGFSLHSMGVQLPFVSHPYTIYAEMDDADGLAAGNGPQVSVAGVPEGQVTAVSYEHGRARVKLQLNGDVRGRLFADASLRVRPFNAANFLEVDIDPGHPAAGPLPAGGTIDPARTSIPVATDQVFDILDADTRSYLQLLTEQAAIALKGRGGELADALAKVNPLAQEAKQLGDMLDERRQLIGQLVTRSDTIFRTLAQRHDQLARVISDGTTLLSVTSSRADQLQQATAELPATLRSVTGASRSFTGVAGLLGRALERFRPAARAFGQGLEATRRTVPALGRFVTSLGSLERGTAGPAAALVRLTGHLGDGIGDAVTAYRNLGGIISSFVAHAHAIAHATDALAGAFSTQDAYGPVARVKLLGIEPPTPADLGLSANAARPGRSGYSELETMLGTALSALCRREAIACVLQALTPGLPGSAVPARDGAAPTDRSPLRSNYTNVTAGR